MAAPNGECDSSIRPSHKKSIKRKSRRRAVAQSTAVSQGAKIHWMNSRLILWTSVRIRCEAHISILTDSGDSRRLIIPRNPSSFCDTVLLEQEMSLAALKIPSDTPQGVFDIEGLGNTARLPKNCDKLRSAFRVGGVLSFPRKS